MISNIKDQLSDFVPSFEISPMKGHSKIEKIAKIAEQVCLVPQTYFHEVGHAIAFKLLYSNTQTHIRIIWGVGGGMRPLCGPPSILGRQLSPRMRDIVTEGSGPLFSVIYTVGLTALGVRLKNAPIVILAVAGLFPEMTYAIKGNWCSHTAGGSTNDYFALKQLGVHPIFPVLGMGCVLMNGYKCLLSLAAENALNK